MKRLYVNVWIEIIPVQTEDIITSSQGNEYGVYTRDTWNEYV